MNHPSSVSATFAPEARPRHDPVRFDLIVTEDIERQVAQAIATHRAAIETICESSERSFDAVLLAKEAADLELSHLWKPISHLTRVADTPELREAHARAEAELSGHGLWVSQNRVLYDATAAARWTGSEQEWDVARRRLRQLSLRDFELSGVALEGEARERYRAIALELTELGTAFANAVLDATDAFHLDVTDEAMLDGIPLDHVERFRAAAVAAGAAGWRIGLKAPDVQAVLTYAGSRELRRTIYEANATRASDRGPLAGRFDNGGRIERIVALRHEAAGLLGYTDNAELSLATKMAASAEEVETFLLGLARAANAAARAEIEEVRAAAAALDLDPLEPWDIAFVSERIRRRLFDFDAEAVRAYFPAERVLAGAMEIIERLFGVRFAKRDDVPLWHSDARYFDVFDRHGMPVAGVYLDLFARPGKKGGAWMDVCRQRFRAAGEVHLPVAFLTCNFAGATGAGEARLRHEEVVTLFHEFGHVLHHILTEVDFPSIGGISGVEWDAVELPSQLMENFAWDVRALASLSRHVETGEPLPRELFDRMFATRNFLSGMRLLRQVEFALFDLRLHRDYDRARGARALGVLAQVREEIAVVDVPEWHRFPHAFTHIFAGGYAAGYYSYLWAELLSADAYRRFAEAGGICPGTGADLRREILARGATRPAAENFTAFRGREPDPRALLESYGLAA